MTCSITRTLQECARAGVGGGRGERVERGGVVDVDGDGVGGQEQRGRVERGAQLRVELLVTRLRLVHVAQQSRVRGARQARHARHVARRVLVVRAEAQRALGVRLAATRSVAASTRSERQWHCRSRSQRGDAQPAIAKAGPGAGAVADVRRVGAIETRGRAHAGRHRVALGAQTQTRGRL